MGSSEDGIWGDSAVAARVTRVDESGGALLDRLEFEDFGGI